MEGVLSSFPLTRLLEHGVGELIVGGGFLDDKKQIGRTINIKRLSLDAVLLYPLLYGVDGFGFHGLGF